MCQIRQNHNFIQTYRYCAKRTGSPTLVFDASPVKMYFEAGASEENLRYFTWNTTENPCFRYKNPRIGTPHSIDPPPRKFSFSPRVSLTPKQPSDGRKFPALRKKLDTWGIIHLNATPTL